MCHHLLRQSGGNEEASGSRRVLHGVDEYERLAKSPGAEVSTVTLSAQFSSLLHAAVSTMNMALSLQHFPQRSALRDRGSVIRTLSEIGSDS